ALGLEPLPALEQLLGYPFALVRLAAYWNHVEPRAGVLVTDELDRLLDAVAGAGRQVVLALGPVKNFGYPEFFVPAHRLPAPLPEGSLISERSHPALLAAAEDVLRALVERYRGHDAVVAWQVEHEAVDPLGNEHSWRLAESFVRREVETVRAADPDRPVLLNGFLPTSQAVRAFQWWNTRDQGDSLDVAQRLADVVGIDYYPRHAVAALGPLTAYLDARRSLLRPRRLSKLLDWAARNQRRIWLTEGQAEPWEAITVPPDPEGRAMASCGPADLIRVYNEALRAARTARVQLGAYLFWGAEYWVRRAQGGDPSYLGAFARVLEESG
ncbi:MAG: beta-galactosidase, partial [Candidatus Dormibacteraeota bacterium]|nr:beta-galactosidase [Candidatus Dormibacteraeota bacterium]